MKRHLATALCLATALPLAAQAPSPAPAKHDDSRLEERAQSMREQIDDGHTVRSHVRVLVRLKNGNKLRGVVKDGRFVERVDGLRFVDAQAKDRGAGIRLWYTSGARNYVFVPFADFAEYQVLQRISAPELEEMEKQLQMEEARKAERLAAAARSAVGKATGSEVPEGAGAVGEVPPAPGQEPGAATEDTATGKTGGGKTGGGKAAGKDATTEPTKGASDVDQQRAWFALLQDYPPTAGWNQAKRDEIARRKVVIGAVPSAHEQKFVDQFAEWEKACQHFAVDKEAKPADAAEAESSSKEHGSRRKRR
ncbi:MAG: hypothetical protein JNM25_16070 [Planctomycetes bacterium]|nr:hypothetical protein [Planctomycetota bacterium]